MITVTYENGPHSRIVDVSVNGQSLLDITPRKLFSMLEAEAHNVEKTEKRLMELEADHCNMTTIGHNVNSEKLSDAEFRSFVKSFFAGESK